MREDQTGSGVGQGRLRRRWRAYLGQISGKLLDFGNIVFAAVIAGQLFDGIPLNWFITLSGAGLWLAMHAIAFATVFFERSDR